MFKGHAGARGRRLGSGLRGAAAGAAGCSLGARRCCCRPPLAPQLLLAGGGRRARGGLSTAPLRRRAFEPGGARVGGRGGGVGAGAGVDHIAKQVAAVQVVGAAGDSGRDAAAQAGGRARTAALRGHPTGQGQQAGCECRASRAEGRVRVGGAGGCGRPAARTDLAPRPSCTLISPSRPPNSHSAHALALEHHLPSAIQRLPHSVAAGPHAVQVDELFAQAAGRQSVWAEVTQGGWHSHCQGACRLQRAGQNGGELSGRSRGVGDRPGIGPGATKAAAQRAL